MTTQRDTERLWRMPDGNVMGIVDAERLLVGAMQECESILAEAVTQLLNFYTGIGQPARAVAQMERVVRMVDSPSTKARALLRLGLLREQLGDFAGAATAYQEAFALEPADPQLWYWTQNNLAFCLNQLGRHVEAEGHCRSAIDTDPRRHNAHKNLGVALAGQDRFLEAAEAFIEATRLNPRDPRALRHLEELLAEQPEVMRRNPALARAVQSCQEAVRSRSRDGQ